MRMPRKSNKKNQNKSYSIFKHVMIGVITTILLLTVVKAVSTAWHAAEEIQLQLSPGVTKTLQQAWNDGDFITDFPAGMVTSRTGSGYYTCGAESCIATCLGNKISLKRGERKYCGRQTWSGWSDYNDNDGYDKIRIKVLFGVNGWNVNECESCSVGSDSYSMAASDQKYGWSYCVPELGGCAPYSYFGDWDRVSRPMQKDVNFKCESINVIGQSDCNPQLRPIANGIRMYTPALDPGLTVADWSASEFSYPTIEPYLSLDFGAAGPTYNVGTGYIYYNCQSGGVYDNCIVTYSTSVYPCALDTSKGYYYPGANYGYATLILRCIGIKFR